MAAASHICPLPPEGPLLSMQCAHPNYWVTAREGCGICRMLPIKDDVPSLIWDKAKDSKRLAKRVGKKG